MPVRMAIIKNKKQEIMSVGKCVEKREPLCTIGGNTNWYNHCGKRYEVASKN